MHNINNFKKKEDVIAYINEHLQGYDGYVQFSNRPIDIARDVFINASVQVRDEKESFISEAHFSNGKESVAIRQMNATWRLSTTDIDNVEVETFYAIADLKVKMAHIWKLKKDEHCLGMDVLTIDKVVFAGFTGGDK